MKKTKILAPDSCPACGGDVTWQNNLLYCLNSDCSAQSYKKIEHFAKTLKIKGLGPRSIEKLGWTSITDIYTSNLHEIKRALNSEVLACKLLKEIAKTKEYSLNSVLPALGIPLIGKTVSEKLSKTCESVEDITEESCMDAGVGPKARESLLQWKCYVFPNLKDLPFSFKFEKTKSPSFIKGVVCISGRLSSYKTKAEATKVLEAEGYIVKASLTKEVTILINESGIESAKTKKAQDMGIEIITNLKSLTRR